jgi:hypothetical protein
VTSQSADRRKVDDGLIVVCGLAWGAGLIHAEAAIGHLDESSLYAALFAVLATAQFVWGAAVYRSHDARLLWAGAAVSLSVVAVWVASRTIGLPFGPQHWQPEPIGLIDSIATADEIVLAVLVTLWFAGGRPVIARKLVLAVAVALLLLSSLSLVGDTAHVG